MKDIILTAKNLTVVKSKREILRVKEVDVRKGDFLAITGPNGAGKSTLLKALAFLESAKGDITFNGDLVRGSFGALRARRKMAMVFQDPLLLSGTPLDNVTIGLKLRGIDKGIREKRAEHWLQKLNVDHLASRDVRTLSGGEAQRVSLARAMALEPDVLFLDEPFTYLDVPTKATLVSELKEILLETGTTTLMVTHDLSDVPFLADRMLVLIEGAVRQAGSVNEVLSHPTSRQVAEFLGVENIWPGQLKKDDNGSWLFCAETIKNCSTNYAKGNCLKPAFGSEAFSKDGKSVLACIRPENLLVYTKEPSESGENLLTGTLEAVYPYGYYYRLKIDCGLRVTALAPTVQFQQLPKLGDRLWIELPQDKIHIIDSDI